MPNSNAQREAALREQHQVSVAHVLRGDWLLALHGDHATARNLANRRELEFTGELARDLADRGDLLRQVAQLDHSLSSLSRAFGVPARTPTVGDILRGPRFRILFLELTGRCNERCRHCYASSSPEVSTALNQDQIASVIRQADEIGFPTLQLTGGDPLISHHFEFAVVEAAKLSFEKLEVYTNALAFNEALANLFVEHSVRMAVSVYSHQPEVHDAVTNTPGSHERTSRAIRLALRSGVPVRIGGVQGIHDAQNEGRLRDYLGTLGVADDMIAMDVQRSVGRGEWNRAAGLLPNKQRGHNSSEDYEGGRLCVTYSGNIVPCIFDRSTALGHVDKMTLEEALQQRVLTGLPRRKLATTGQSLSCAQCRFRNHILHTTFAAG